MEIQTIAVLTHKCEELGIHQKVEISNGCFEAFTSLEAALTALGEEYDSIVKERIYRGDVICHNYIYWKDPEFETIVVYVDNQTGVHYRDTYHIEMIDLKIE